MTTTIRAVVSDEEYLLARKLVADYAKELGVNLNYQGFDQELADLRIKYGPPTGAILLAFRNEVAAGCVAVRPLENGDCEMKRLFVAPEHRGLNIGHDLAKQIITTARDIGYRRMLLDTLPRLEAAMHVYQTLGFIEIAPYYDNPIPNVRFFELTLE